MAVKRMAIRRDDACSVCSTELPAGTKAQWDSIAKALTCLACVGDVAASTEVPAPEVGAGKSPEREAPDEVADEAAIDLGAIDRGTAGASARHEFERRRAKREARVEEKWGTGRIGRVAKALSTDPQTTTAWDKGAAGEIAVSQALNDRLGDRAVVLDDRKATRGRANFDHLVIAPSGVWIVDSKNYTGRPEWKDVGGWFSTDVRLFVGNRDRSSAVKGMEWQRDAVRTVLDEAGFEAAPLHLALCMYRAEWGLFTKPFQVDGVWVIWAKKLAERMLDNEVLDPDTLARAAVFLAERFPRQRVT